MKYVAVGDPIADMAVESLAHLGQEQVHHLIEAGMEQKKEDFSKAPQALQDFFAQVDSPPSWFDSKALEATYSVFHNQSDIFIPAFFVVTLQNAATLIAKAFFMTGRVKTEHGYRRIRQNVRHFIEIMMPGGLDHQGDGRKLSLRIRLVHAQVRYHLRTSGRWDEAKFGHPLSSAHMGLASANFSATMLHQARKLGAKMDAKAASGFMQAWRYASWLTGTPEELLFEGDEKKTMQFGRVATAIDPKPNNESTVIARTLVNAIPHIAGVTDELEGHSMIDHTFRVSRALLGKRLSDQLFFPPRQVWGVLSWLQFKRKVRRWLERLSPSMAKKWQGKNFIFLLDATVLQEITYNLPDKLKADESAPW